MAGPANYGASVTADWILWRITRHKRLMFVAPTDDVPLAKVVYFVTRDWFIFNFSHTYSWQKQGRTPRIRNSRNIRVAHDKVTTKGKFLDAKVFWLYTLHIATLSVHSEFMGWRCVLSTTRDNIYCKTLIDVLIMLQSQEILFASSR